MATTFIGGGNMATALIGGMLARGAGAGEFRVVEPSAEARRRMSGHYAGVRLFGECTTDAVAAPTSSCSR
jgi:pyrroline-5-carboxylate reductase